MATPFVAFGGKECPGGSSSSPCCGTGNSWCTLCQTRVTSRGCDHYCRHRQMEDVPFSQDVILGVDDMSGSDTQRQKIALAKSAWLAANANGVHAKYLREVEALRGKLRELRGSTAPPGGRRLPPTPTVPSTLVQEVQDSKRSRNLSESEASSYQSNLAVAVPKRPREKSPLLVDPTEDLSCDVSSDSSFEDFNESPPELKMAVTKATEREGGDCFVLRVEKSNQPCCSASPVNNWPKDDEPKSTKLETANGFTSLPNSPHNCAQSSHRPLPLSPFRSHIVTNPEPAPSIALTYSSTSLSSVSYDDITLPEATNSYFRPSLFSNVPPYIRFIAQEEKAEKQFPKSIQRVLKWKLSTITPIVVRHTVANSGFRLVKRKSGKDNPRDPLEGSGDWAGIWGRHMKSICFRTLRDNQKINHLPGTFQIGRKDRLWRNVYHMMNKFGKKEFGFIPRTFVLPQDGKALRQAWDKVGSSRNKWIVKPPAGARGTGIKVINKWTQVPKKIPVIVQRYISNPYLINGNKFDLRLYVLVTSFNPLRIYLNTNGLVRFASVKYSDESATLNNRFMHLTNYSINKLSTNYAQNEDAESCTGHKWTIRSLWSYLENYVNVDALWDSLVDLVIKTMISGENGISNLTTNNLSSRYSAYELFGVDVLLDECLKPWLLEVNISPSLHSTSPLDIAVKSPMVKDILNIAGYHIPDKFNDAQTKDLKSTLKVDGPLCYDPRMYVTDLSPAEKTKQAFFCKIDDRDYCLNHILNDLTPDDVRHLITYEDELTQLGSFQKVFPTINTYEYFQFFEDTRYYNMLYDAWETRYHMNRNEGHKILESKCREQMHFDVSEVESKQITYCASDASITDVRDECTVVRKVNGDTGAGGDTDSPRKFPQTHPHLVTGIIRPGKQLLSLRRRLRPQVFASRRLRRKKPQS